MEDAVSVDIARVLPMSVDTDNCEMFIVEPVRTRADAESGLIVLPVRVENETLMPCNVLVASVERIAISLNVTVLPIKVDRVKFVRLMVHARNVDTLTLLA